MERIELKAAWAVDDEGTITGLASPYDTPDRIGDVVRKGAYSGVKLPLPLLHGHNHDEPIGVVDELVEAPDGLRFKGRLLHKDVGRAAEVRALILAGGLTGVSIGYVPTKAAPRKGGRELLAIDLLEISVVAVPMHPAARLTSAKAASEREDMETPDITQLAEKVGQMESKAVAAVGTAVADAMRPLVDRLDKLEAKGQRSAGGGGAPEPSTYQKAFADYLRTGPLSSELKGLNLSSDPNGGYLAPPELSSEILRDLVEFSPIRRVASVRSTVAPSVIYPTRKPMGNATWDGEGLATPETSTTDIFGALEVQLKGASTFVDVSNMLLQDAPAVQAEVTTALAEDFGKKESVAFVNGNGILAPEGVMVNADIQSSMNGHASILQADALIRLLYSMPATYRNAPGAAWAMNGTTLAAVRLLKDADANYLWQPSYQLGQPETLLGRPVIEVLDMPNVAANAFPIIYGDFSGYRILDRLDLSILVDPYSQAINQTTRYHARRRVGGRVIMPAKFRKLQIAV